MRSTILIMSLFLMNCGLDIRGMQGPPGPNGSYAFASLDKDGNTYTTYNFYSVTKISIGLYQFVFLNDAPSANYGVLVTSANDSVMCAYAGKTEHVFRVVCADSTGTGRDTGIDVFVFLSN